MPGEDGKMTFLEHLEELRRRLFYCVIAIVAGVIVCWVFREEIRTFLEAPLYEAWGALEGLPPPQPLGFTSLIEPFMVYMKLAGIGGLFLAVPVILYNLWKFVSPGLYARERRIALPFVFVSTLLFVGGSTLSYSYVFPVGIRFFLDFAAGGARAELEATASSSEGGELAPRAPDAGAPAAEEDGGTAGIEDGGAPGPIAGPSEVTSEAAPMKRREPLPPKQRTLYELALEKILQEGCGELAAEGDGVGGVALRLSWHEEACGAVPDIVLLERDGSPIALDWGVVSDAPKGFSVREARDLPPKGGRHAYRLKTLSRGEDGRKLAPVLMISDYLSFALKLMFAFGILFELPVLIVFLSLGGIVTSRGLLRFSRWFILVALVIGAVLTPPDVFTQVMFAGPLVVLYFASVVIAFFIERGRARRSREG